MLPKLFGKYITMYARQIVHIFTTKLKASCGELYLLCTFSENSNSTLPIVKADVYLQE